MTAPTDQQILEKAIRQAIDGGFKYGNGFKFCSDNFMRGTNINVGTDRPLFYLPYEQDYPLLIFNHNFAHAIWGDEDGYELCGSTVDGKMWQCHLQQMVIADDPIQYLGDNL